MKIIYFGSAQFGIPSLEAIYHSGHELVGVFTQPARPAGRHRSKPHHTDVDLWCNRNSVPCVEAENINTPEMMQRVAALEADLLVVIAFGQKIRQEVITLQTHGAVNVHASLLPKYRGAAPIHWAILNGEIETGVSIITLADKMDAGLILAQGTVDISPDDTVKCVHDKLSVLSVPVLMGTIEQIANGSAVYTEQNPTQVTKAPKLKKKDGYINWDNSAAEIVNQIRALWPWPAAETVYVCSKTGKNWRVGIAKARVVEREQKQGDITGMLDENLNIICSENALEIIELKPAGSRLMDFAAYANGHQCGAGDLFVSDDKALNGIV
ncbi:MAG: methionyl-tRNA formyltransferase [Planctomycetes bacterium]|nr:methionyl-tRNA formyltransferase [Planctomycetota bacterium]